MVCVELFGIARQRAGVEEVHLEANSLREALAALAKRFPELAKSCFDGGQLRHGFIANLNGDRFITDPETLIRPDDSLLILSADAGG